MFRFGYRCRRTRNRRTCWVGWLNQRRRIGEVTEHTDSVAGDFNAAGLGLGSGASPILERSIQPTANDVDADLGLVEQIEMPTLQLAPDEDVLLPPGEIAEDQVSIDPLSSTTIDIERINAALEQVSQSLYTFSQSLKQPTTLSETSSDEKGLTENIQRAIVETAANTRKIAERAQSGGLVFA